MKSSYRIAVMVIVAAMCCGSCYAINDKLEHPGGGRLLAYALGHRLCLLLPLSLQSRLGCSLADAPDTGLARQPITVIGAGYGRTGTDSLRTALTLLGYRTYHMLDVIGSAESQRWEEFAGAAGSVPAACLRCKGYWRNAASAECSNCPAQELAAYEAAVDKLLDGLEGRGFNATTDFPLCLLFDHMLRRNPEARVVLSVRSSAQAWAHSYRSSIGHIHKHMTRQPLRTLFKSSVSIASFLRVAGGFGPQEWNPRDAEMETVEELVESYNNWVAQVKAHVPAEQLLVHQAQDGWEPLCQHLGMGEAGCPSARGEPYPHVNSRAGMRVGIAIITVASIVWPYGYVAAILVMLLTVWKCCCGGAGGAVGGKAKVA